MQERDGEEYLRRWPESRRYPESDQNSAAGGAETSLHHSPCGHDPCPHTPLCMDRDDHPLPPPPLDDGITWFLPFAISALLVVLLLFAFGSHMYGGHKNLVTIEQCAEACDTAKTQTYGMVDLQIDTLVDWLGEIDDSYYAEKRGRALLLSASQSDNLMIGVYDQYHRNKYDDAALFYVFAALNGYQEADGLLRGLSLTLEQSNDVKNRLIDVHQMNGGAGFLKLGQISLDESFQKPGPAAVADRFYYRYSAYLPTRSNSQAFIYFQLAASCGYGEAYDWLTYMAPIDGLSPEYKDELRQNAGDALANLLDQYNVDKAEFCSGEYARRTIQARMPEPNRGGSGRPGELQIYSADGSKAFRDNPGGSSGQPGSTIAPNCVGNNNPENCVDRRQFLTCADESRYWFNRGEAEMAVGNTGLARAFFSEAIEMGRSCGAESAVLASRRLGALNLTCEYSPESLARISRNAYDEGVDGAIIDLRIRQRALEALGHYQGTIDGKYGPQTRRAVSEFQRELGFEETGDLSPLETVYLICSAADNARDRNAKNVLGLMYVTGLGVVQNTDTGLLWLKDAADSGDIDALYNLAIIYGSGTVLSSYRMCDVVESVERADAYLMEARDGGHPIATQLLLTYGALRPADRWQAIKSRELEKVEFYNERFGVLGKACGADLNAAVSSDDL